MATEQITEQILVVAIEDSSTVECVGPEAARIAAEHHSTRLLVLHVLDPHPLSGAAIAMSGYYIPLEESPEDGKALLERTQAAILAEFARLQVVSPTIELLVGHGEPAHAIEQVITHYGAKEVVLGARHRHALGKLVYTDVRAHLHCLDMAHVHVAPLKESVAGSPH